MNLPDCIRCGKAPGVDGNGYCGHCHWVVKAEVHHGLDELEHYLSCWARFRAWEAKHPSA